MVVTIYVATMLIFSFPIGHMIDRINNTALNFLSSFMLIAGFALLFAGEGIFYIYGATALSVFGLEMKLDTFSAIIKKHIPEGSFKKANSFSYAATSASELLGTLLGGLSIIYLRYYFIFVLLAVALATAFLSLPISEEKYNANAGENAMIVEMKEVMSLLKNISGILILAFFINGLFISLDTYSSGLFDLVLKSSAIYYTAFTTCFPLGMMAGTPVANVRYFKKERPLTIALMLLLFSPLIMVLALSRSPLADVIDAFAIGLVLPIINIPIQTKLMAVIPHRVYGKTMGFLKIFMSGASPVMGSVFSTLALFFSIPAVLFWVSVLVVPLTAYGVLVIPKFFSYNAAGKG